MEWILHNLIVGKDYLCVIDYYSKYISRYFVIEKKTAFEISNKLKTIAFPTHGIPIEIVYDNMPFNSFEIKKFCKSFDIVITTTSPNYPQSNSKAERCVRISKIFWISSIYLDFFAKILEYAYQRYELTPNQLLRGRSTRSCIPEIYFKSNDRVHEKPISYWVEVKETGKV